MGNRAVIKFTDGNEAHDVGVYLHWAGSHVREWLEAAAPRMRKGDVSYAAARFCGYCHEQIDGGLSLGILPGALCDDPGDNGLYVVDVRDGRVTRFRMGYGKDYEPLGLARAGRPFTVKLGGF